MHQLRWRANFYNSFDSIYHFFHNLTICVLPLLLCWRLHDYCQVGYWILFDTMVALNLSICGQHRQGSWQLCRSIVTNCMFKISVFWRNNIYIVVKSLQIIVILTRITPLNCKFHAYVQFSSTINYINFLTIFHNAVASIVSNRSIETCSTKSSTSSSRYVTLLERKPNFEVVCYANLIPSRSCVS